MKWTMDVEVDIPSAVALLVVLELRDDVDILTLLLEKDGDEWGPILGLAVQRRAACSRVRVVGYAENVVPFR